jgi:hypothetical protein
MTTDKDELAALKKKVEELEAKVSPPKSTFVPKTDAEWADEMHQMRERRMALATPPSVIRDWAVIPEHIVRGVVQDRHAPTSPSMAGTSGAVTRVHLGGGAPVNNSGWVAPTPLRPPDGVAQADRLMDAADARDRIELAQRIAAHEAAMRAAKGKG